MGRQLARCARVLFFSLRLVDSFYITFHRTYSFQRLQLSRNHHQGDRQILLEETKLLKLGDVNGVM